MHILRRLNVVLMIVTVFNLPVFLSACEVKTEKSFGTAPTDYFGYLEDDKPEDISLSGELLSPTGCRITALNENGKKAYNLGNEYEIYRRSGGEWLPVKKKLEAGSNYWNDTYIKAGKTLEFYFDWSYEYGELEAGSYKLVTFCSQENEKQKHLVSWDFAIPRVNPFKEDKNPYGYGGKVSEAEDISMTAEMLSPHRYRLTVNEDSKTYYTFDRTWGLYARDGNEWVPVKQKVKQPPLLYMVTRYWGLDGKYVALLSPYYGALPKGDYLIVKRCVKSDDDNKWPQKDFRCRLASDFKYVTAEIHLDSDLPEPDYIPDIADWYGYTQDSPKLADISGTVENLSLTGCSIIMKNSGGKTYSAGDEFHIYKLVGGEWLPVKHPEYNFGWGLIPTMLQPGGSARFDANWSYIYGRLAPGDYVLVNKIYEDGKPATTLKGFRFTLTDDMVRKDDNPYGYTASSKLLEGAVMTAEKISSHRYKLTLTRGGKNTRMRDLSYALYKNDGGAWVPMPCKYDIDNHFYMCGSAYYYLQTDWSCFPVNDIIDISALYGNLAPGRYRLVRRCGEHGDYSYVTADIDYKT